MALVQIAAPPAEPVTLAEARAHLRVDHAEEDALIETLLASAREYCETFTRRAFVPRTLELVLDRFPYGSLAIGLPRAPLRAVTSVVYSDVYGAEQTLDPSLYLVLTDYEPGQVSPIYGDTWPQTRLQPGAVRVRFEAGYPDDPDAAAGAVPPENILIPAGIKTAMNLLAAHWYQNRESVVTGTIATQVPMGVDMLLWPFRVYAFP